MPSRSSFRSSQTYDKLIYHYLDGSTSPDVPSPSFLTWTDSVTFGDNFSNWRQLLRDGVNATTTMNGTKKECRVTNGAVTFRLKSPTPPFYIRVTGKMRLSHFIPGENPATVSTANADNLALGKFQQKLSLVNTAIQGGVVLGELRQTLQTIRNPALGLRRLVSDQQGILQRIRAARRLGPILLHKRRIAEHLADAWLELQFGWKPLLSDIRSGAQALDQYSAGQSVSTKRITAVETTNKEILSLFGADGESFAQWRTRLTGEECVTAIYRGAVRVKARDPQTMDPALLGFNPGSFLPTAWELLPYSFLIDYFTNIGGIIYGLSNLFTELAWCNRTIRQSVEYRQFAEELPNSGVTVSGAWPKVFCSTSRVSRATYTGTTVPGVAFKIPGFGSLKWLNIAALIASRKADRSWTFD